MLIKLLLFHPLQPLLLFLLPASTLAPAPVANTQQANTQTASASELFPFDPTLAAIERRQNAKQGIMSVT